MCCKPPEREVFLWKNMEQLKPCPYLESDGKCGVWLPKPSGAEWTRKGRGQQSRIIRLCRFPGDLASQAECDRGQKPSFDVFIAVPEVAEIDRL